MTKQYFSSEYYINKTARSLGDEPGLKPYVDRLFKWGNGLGYASGIFGIPTLSYTNPIVNVKNATGTARIFQRDDIAAKMSISAKDSVGNNIGNLKKGSVIPWNPAWLKISANGGDSLLTIIDEDNGIFYELWMVDKNPVWWNYLGSLAQIAVAGQTVGVGTANKWSTLYTEKDNTFLKGRGCGLVKLAGTLTIDELEAEHINHAIGWYCPVPMFGPNMVNEGGTNWKQYGAGTSLGFYLKGGATRLEHANPVTLAYGGVTMWPADDAHREMAQPSGIRYAHTRSPASIESWIKGRGYQGARAKTARTLAVACGAEEGHGFFFGDTCGNGGSTFEFEGGTAPGALKRIGDLGLNASRSYSDRILDGLFTVDNTIVIKPLA